MNIGGGGFPDLNNIFSDITRMMGNIPGMPASNIQMNFTGNTFNSGAPQFHFNNN